MNENKICPLLSVSQDRRSGPLPEGVGVAWAYCQGESCAWYMRPTVYEKDDFCAVKALAALPDLAKKVGQL